MRGNYSVTVAVLVKNGVVIGVGTNQHNDPCTRLDAPMGVGYETCKGCHPDNHAEKHALAYAGEEANGATLFLYGHHFICQSCADMLRHCGVTKFVIL